MQRYDLYINDTLVELNNDSLVLFTYQLPDATSPTAIKNSYSKTINIPGTRNNNRIFNNIGQFDYKRTGDMINPSLRIPFYIKYNGSIVKRGYLKLNKINKNGNYVSYDVTLYGGLGDVFYALTYRYDGTKLTLNDLFSYDYYDLDFDISRTNVRDAWNVLRDGTEHFRWNIINFAPCYNGKPDHKNFDAKKILVSLGTTTSRRSTILNGVKVNGTQYDYLPFSLDGNNGWAGSLHPGEVNTSWGLIETNDELTEWEVRDLRSYLQRPIVRFKEVLHAMELYIRDTLHYNVEFDPAFFNEDNPYYNDMWLTLNMLYENKEDIKSYDSVTHSMLFGSSQTPFDYLVSYAKMFRLFFVFDDVTNTLKILTVENYYKNVRPIDINDKVDKTSMSVNPIYFDYKWAHFKYTDNDSDLFEMYSKKYGRPYGVYRIDTGYDFNSDIKELPDKIIYKTAIDTIESSPYFVQKKSKIPSRTNYNDIPTFFNNGPVKYSLFSQDSSGNYSAQSYDIEASPSSNATISRWSYGQTKATSKYYYDSFAKIQLHDNDNNAIDGADVFVIFNGMSYSNIYNPGGTTSESLTYYLSDDIVGCEVITGGKQCWINNIVGDTSTMVVPATTPVMVPMFNRAKFSYNTGIYHNSLDFGVPAELYTFSQAVLDNDETLNVKTGWTKYMSDLDNADTRVVECKVALDNNNIESAMRYFYTFDNTVWVITKIKDFNICNKFTNVEFTKVNNQGNYVTKIEAMDSTINLNMTGGRWGFNWYAVGDLDTHSIWGESDVQWITNLSVEDHYPDFAFDVANNTGSTRTGHITIHYGRSTDVVTVIQKGRRIIIDNSEVEPMNVNEEVDINAKFIGSNE